MEIFLLVVSLIFNPSVTNLDGDIHQTQLCLEDPDAFWPPDMVPHPTLPGHEPSGPSEPELA